MKRCPQCNRVESDDALVFCRADGTRLVSDSSSLGSEAGTAKLGLTATESETSILPHTTDNAVNRATAPTIVLPAPSAATTGALAKRKSRRTAITIAVIAVVVSVAGLGLYKFFNRSQPKKLISFASAKIARLTTTGKATRVAFSPDGKQFAFVRSESGKEFALMIANADGTGERKLVARKNPPESIGHPAWSPDGKRIAYRVRNADSNDDTIFEAQVADGSTKPLTSQRWFRISALAWLSDGGGLLMLATPQQQNVRQVWQLSYPEGEAHRLTNDLNDYDGMSLTADSGTLAVVKTERQANVWVAPTGDASRTRPITSGSGKNDTELTFAPDGTKIIYQSNASGDEDIWIVNADGGNPRQLTANSRVNLSPAVAPDGRSIVFLSDRTSTPHLWRMNVDGSDQRQLTNGSGEKSPQFSPDGRWVVYTKAFGKATVWKVPAAGGEPVQLNDKYSTHPTVSPDSKLVAYRYRDENTPWRIAVAPLEGGEPLKTFDLPATFGVPLRWTPDGRALAYVDTRGGVSNIVAQPLDGGAP